MRPLALVSWLHPSRPIVLGSLAIVLLVPGCRPRSSTDTAGTTTPNERVDELDGTVLGESAETRRQQPDGTDSRDAERNADGSIPIPLPDLSVVDPAVREQIDEADAALTSLRQRSDVPPAELATAYGELGMLYHTYQLFDAAEACYRNAHQLVPDSFRWAYCLGTVYDSKNEPSKVIPPLETAVKLQPNSVPALVNLAEAHLLTENSESAASLFRRALNVDPTCAVALVGLGRIAADRQDFAEAIRQFEAALIAQPGATAIHYPLAMAYRRSGNLDQAKVHLEQRGDVPAQIDDPLMAELRQLRTGARFYEKHAVAAGKAGQLEIAIDDLRRAVEAEPESPSAHLNLGTALALQGDKDAAIEHYRKALQLKPGFARAHCNLAVLLSERGAIREAVENFREAIQIDPDYFDAHLALADLLAQGGRYEIAASYYARALAIDPRHRMARLHHAQALIRAGRYADAKASLEEARQVLPESMVLAHALARLLATCPDASQRDGPGAIVLATAVFQTRKSAEHAETLAMAYAEVNDYEQAKYWQAKAIKLVTEATPSGFLVRLQHNLKRYENGQSPLLPRASRDDGIRKP